MLHSAWFWVIAVYFDMYMSTSMKLRSYYFLSSTNSVLFVTNLILVEYRGSVNEVSIEGQ